MFLVNSRLGLFTAAPVGSCRKGLHQKGHSFSRSYGVNLPSSLTRVISSALGFSPYPPVSVLVRVPRNLTRDFSCQRSISDFRPKGHGITSQDMRSPDLPGDLPTGLHILFYQYDHLASCVLPSLITIPRQYRNINLLSTRLRLSASA